MGPNTAIGFVRNKCSRPLPGGKLREEKRQKDSYIHYFKQVSMLPWKERNETELTDGNEKVTPTKGKELRYLKGSQTSSSKTHTLRKKL